MEKTRKLTSNEEKVRKKLEKFPRGVKAAILNRELHMSKTTLYETLHRLEIKEKAFRGEHSLWYPNLLLGNQDSNGSVISLNFFERWRIAGIEKRRRENEEWDREIIMRGRNSAAIMEIMFLPKEIRGRDRIEKANEIRKKYGLL